MINMLQTKLRGPFSPLEMKVFGMTRSSQGKNIQVEWNSVNSVLLDAEPQDPHERLVIFKMGASLLLIRIG